MSNGNFVSKYDVEGAWIGLLEGPMVGSRPAKIKSRLHRLRGGPGAGEGRSADDISVLP